jgi:putative transposase
MRQEKLEARGARAGGLPVIQASVRAYPLAPNRLDRSFDAAQPYQRWVADFTYIWATEGWLYVAVVLDLYSRRVAGWSMKHQMTAERMCSITLNGFIIPGGDTQPWDT